MHAPPRRKLLDKTGETHEVDNPEKRPPLPYDDFRIYGRSVSPLRRNRADRAVIDAQQEPLAGPVMAFAHAGELTVRERMEGVGHADKLRRSDGMVCFRRRVTNGLRKGVSPGLLFRRGRCAWRGHNWRC